MPDLTSLPIKLDFLRELLGNRQHQYRQAYWLKNEFKDHLWTCAFEHRTTLINFNISFLDGTKLTDAKHALLLETIKCFLCVQTHSDATEGKKLSAASNYRRLNKALKIIDYFLLRLEHYPLHLYGLSILSHNDFTTMLYDIGRHKYIYQSIYQWHEHLSAFLKEKIQQENQKILEDILRASPVLKDLGRFTSADTLHLSKEELEKARAWLYLHDCYLTVGEHNTLRAQPNTKKLATLIYANTLGGTETNFPLIPELSYQPNSFRERECLPIAVFHSNTESTRAENDFMVYFNVLQHLRLLRKINLPVPDEAISEIQPQLLIEALKLKQSQRFRTLPSKIVFSALRQAFEFALDYGEDLIDSYLSIMKSVKQSGHTFIQWKRNNKSISIFLTPKIQALGVACWKIKKTKNSHVYRDHTYYQRLRANEGLWDLLRVLYGAIQMVVGTLMARRYTELADLMPMSCLDRERTHLIFFVGKTGYNGKRERVARPIPAVVAKLIGLIEFLQKTLLKEGIIKQYSPLFAYPHFHGCGLAKIIDIQFNRSFNAFCDYIEMPINSQGERYYIRQHMLRRFFAMLFFWGGSFGGMDTLRWFLAHSDVEHLYHYVTETTTGEVLRSVKSHYAAERLKAYDESVESLADLLEQHFGTRKFDMLPEQELDTYIEHLIKEGDVTVEPEFFIDTVGKSYRILVKVTRGRSCQAHVEKCHD